MLTALSFSKKKEAEVIVKVDIEAEHGPPLPSLSISNDSFMLQQTLHLPGRPRWAPRRRRLGTVVARWNIELLYIAWEHKSSASEGDVTESNFETRN
eukprot:gene16939-23213_t